MLKAAGSSIADAPANPNVSADPSDFIMDIGQMVNCDLFISLFEVFKGGKVPLIFCFIMTFNFAL